MELNMPAQQEEMVLEYHGKIFQENGQWKKLLEKQIDHWRNITFMDPGRSHLPRVTV